jgi:hypothetical protein
MQTLSLGAWGEVTISDGTMRRLTEAGDKMGMTIDALVNTAREEANKHKMPLTENALSHFLMNYGY